MVSPAIRGHIQCFGSRYHLSLYSRNRALMIPGVPALGAQSDANDCRYPQLGAYSDPSRAVCAERAFCSDFIEIPSSQNSCSRGPMRARSTARQQQASRAERFPVCLVSSFSYPARRSKWARVRGLKHLHEDFRCRDRSFEPTIWLGVVNIRPMPVSAFIGSPRKSHIHTIRFQIHYVYEMNSNLRDRIPGERYRCPSWRPTAASWCATLRR